MHPTLPFYKKYDFWGSKLTYIATMIKKITLFLQFPSTLAFQFEGKTNWGRFMFLIRFTEVNGSLEWRPEMREEARKEWNDTSAYVL